MTRLRGVVLVGTLAALGCSSDDPAPVATSDLGPGTLATDAPVPSLPPSDTEPMVESTVPSTEVATTVAVTTVATTVATTTVATTTTEMAPTTTSLDDLRAEIEADLNEGEQAELRAGDDPAAALESGVLEQYNTGAALVRARDEFQSLASERLYLRASDAVPNVIVVLDIAETNGSSAVVVLCRVDAAVVYELAPDGSESIVNDVVARYETRTNLQLEDDVWKISDGETLDRFEGETTCAE